MIKQVSTILKVSMSIFRCPWPGQSCSPFPGPHILRDHKNPFQSSGFRIPVRPVGQTGLGRHGLPNATKTREAMTGIEPTLPPWQGGVIPVYHIDILPEDPSSSQGTYPKLTGKACLGPLKLLSWLDSNEQSEINRFLGFAFNRQEIDLFNYYL